MKRLEVSKYILRSLILASATFAVAFGQQPQPASQQDDPGPAAAGPLPSDSQSGTWRRLGGQPVPQQAPAPINVPPQLTIPAGSFLTIRVDQELSSKNNQSGDTFSATLVKPVVVDGLVVADRGQTIAGRVAEALKAGKIKGQSTLAIELMELTLVDGQQVPLRSQLIGRSGGSSTGRDATAIVTTSGIGAAIGAAAGSGRGNIGAGPGAAAGAGAGALAAAIGVLLTRGKDTYIDPETLLTFRLDAPITINTARAPQAFRTVSQGDYNQPQDQPRQVVRVAASRPYPVGLGGWGGGWGGWGYPGYGWGYPYYGFGPRVVVGVGGYRGFGGGFGGYRGGFGGPRGGFGGGGGRGRR